VSWIWVGLVVIVFGTFIALVPSLSPATASLRVPAARAAPPEPVATGGHS
jgi:cytochrome c-type biogenesis protein CcmF